MHIIRYVKNGVIHKRLVSNYINLVHIAQITEKPYIVHDLGTNKVYEYGQINNDLSYSRYFGEPNLNVDEWLENQRKLTSVRNLVDKL